MICKRLDWDSDFFEKEIAEIEYEVNISTDFSELNVFDLIVVKNNEKEDLIIPNFELNFQETKVLFSKKISESAINRNYLILDTDENQIKNDVLYPLAFESGKYSRFKLDSNFQEEKFKELYKKWVDNSINKKFADKVFYIQQDHKIMGFVTLKKHQNSASIGLIAVESNSQGKGYGSMLLEKVEQYCEENKIVELQIPTQKENRLACQFYSKLGYIIIQEINIKHYWKS
jgi:dTDP-4-amino-4,6-dideoxy-D-galactose acyltransferase